MCRKRFCPLEEQNATFSRAPERKRHTVHSFPDFASHPTIFRLNPWIAEPLGLMHFDIAGYLRFLFMQIHPGPLYRTSWTNLFRSPQHVIGRSALGKIMVVSNFVAIDIKKFHLAWPLVLRRGKQTPTQSSLGNRLFSAHFFSAVSALSHRLRYITRRPLGTPLSLFLW